MRSFLIAFALVVSAGVPTATLFAGDIFKKPILLTANNQLIDSGAAWGHSGPCLEDLDGDGDRDLIVGDFSGTFQFWKNVGSGDEPKYEDGGKIQANEEDAKVKIYCCIGSSPQFADVNGDGIRDLLSGSYDPGYLYYFPGKKDGDQLLVDFGERKEFVGSDGVSVKSHPEIDKDYASFGSWPVLVDWDNDGDLDLVFGSFAGEVFVRLNEGTRAEPSWSKENIPVSLDGQLRNDHLRHAAIAIADWDGDGLFDLLTGSESGAVYWHPNVGNKSSPHFGQKFVLIPPSSSNGYSVPWFVDQPPRPGIRSQIFVSDYNNDGLLDLLVGDFQTNAMLRSTLTADEKELVDRLWKESNEIGRKNSHELNEITNESFRTNTYAGAFTDQGEKYWSEKYEAWRSSEECKQREKRFAEISHELKPFLATGEQRKSIPAGKTYEDTESHGFVWLYVRKPNSSVLFERMPAATTLDRPVAWGVRISRESNQRDQLCCEVLCRIAPGYHIGRLGDDNELDAVTRIISKLPEPAATSTQWHGDKPRSGASIGSPIPIYEGDERFQQTWSLPENTPNQFATTIHIHYQPCNAIRCLRPQEEKLVVEFNLN